MFISTYNNELGVVQNLYSTIVDDLVRVNTGLKGVIENIDNKTITKNGYNIMMNSIAEKREQDSRLLSELKSKTNDILQNMDRLKETLIKNKENAEEFRILVDELARKVNERYFKTGNRLTKLALSKLPNEDDMLSQQILDSLEDLNIDETEKQNIKDTYLSAVAVERNRGGKRRSYTRKRKNRKYK